MPVATLPTLPQYVPAAPTQADLDYADLAIIDLSTATSPAARAQLAEQVHTAIAEHGFFYVVGHGYRPEQTARMFDIADMPFAHVSAEEKQAHAGTMEQTGSYQGYKLRNYWHIDAGVRDQIEHYNINMDPTKKQHPVALRPFIPEIRSFAEFNHRVLHEVLRLMALGLGLPEETLVDIHGFDNPSSPGETYVRFMKYYPRSEEDETKTKNVWLKGHTDFGSVTILWSQPVEALQILARDGSWKWVRYIPNALVINAGDALAFLTGGRLRATVHRVVRPPPDQRTAARLGVFYFCMPDDAVRLTPLPGLGDGEEDGEKAGGQAPVLTMEQWRRGRTTAYGRSELRAGGEPRVEEEVINGVVVKHYN